MSLICSSDLMTELAAIFDRICSSGLTIVSQQRNEPDLTRDENHRVLQRLYETNPSSFVYRFASILTDDELNRHFDPNADFIRQLTKTNREKTRANRRFTYMQQLLANGTYFSEESMKERSPLLYEQMISKYNHGVNRTPVLKTAQGVLTDFYMEHLESLNHHERVEAELRLEEEEDDDDEEEDDEEDHPNAERDLYQQEFLAIHKGKTDSTGSFRNVFVLEKFLNGEDSNIDYASIDNDENLDNLPIRERDEEEKYFDEDENEENS